MISQGNGSGPLNGLFVWRQFVLACAIALVSVNALAEQVAEQSESPVLTFGPAAERSTRGGNDTSTGGAAALEFTAIEGWLEIEIGGSVLSRGGHREKSADVIFKKPFRISDTSEFMIGIGPSFIKTMSGADKRVDHAIELNLDFMFWATKSVGWYVTPSWSIVPSSHDQSVGISAGLLLRL